MLTCLLVHNSSGKKKSDSFLVCSQLQSEVFTHVLVDCSVYICSCRSVFSAENMHLTNSHIVLTAAVHQKMIAGKWCAWVGAVGVRTEKEKQKKRELKLELKNIILQGL